MIQRFTTLARAMRNKALPEAAGEGLLKNVLTLTSVQFFRKILPLITIPYLARVLGPASWGLVAIFQSLAMCTVIVIEFGFQLYATRQVARCRHSENLLADVFVGVLGAQGLLALGAALVVAIVAPFVTVLRDHPAFVVSALLWSIAEGVNPIWYFVAMERMKAAAVIEICSKTAAAAAIFILVHSANDAGIVMAVQAIAPILSIVGALRLVRRDIPFRVPSVRLIRQALRGGWSMFIMRGAESLYTLANAFLLGLLAGPVAASYFAGPEKVSRALLGWLNPVRDALYPRLSKLVHTSFDQAARLARTGIAVTILGGMCMGLLVFLSAPLLVHILLGPQFEPAVQVLRMLAILPPLTSVTQSIGLLWLLPLGHERVVSRAIVATGILNVCLAFLLVPKHGYIGMAWAVLCSEAFACVCVVCAAVALRHHRPVPASFAILASDSNSTSEAELLAEVHSLEVTP
jgi:polysaccharide transporter, PST family